MTYPLMLPKWFNPKPVRITRRKWLAPHPDWDWEAWKQTVYYPSLSAKTALANPDEAWEPHVVEFECGCDICSNNDTRRICALELATKPDSWGKLWHPHDFDVHHNLRRGSHPEDKFSVLNCTPIHRECHRRRIHG